MAGRGAGRDTERSAPTASGHSPGYSSGHSSGRLDAAADARAAVTARTTLAASPDAPQALFSLAALLLRNGDPEAAALLPRLERHAGYAPGWLAVADALLARGQPGAAAAAAARGLRAAETWRLRPELAARGGHLLGRALLEERRPGEAASAFRTALAADPNHAEGWFSLGSVLQDLREHVAAADAYAEALRLRPALHEAALNRAVALGECGRLEEALDAYAHALRLRPDSFGRIAQALCSGRAGMVVLEPTMLRRMLERRGAAATSGPERWEAERPDSIRPPAQ